MAFSILRVSRVGWLAKWRHPRVLGLREDASALGGARCRGWGRRTRARLVESCVLIGADAVKCWHGCRMEGQETSRTYQAPVGDVYQGRRPPPASALYHDVRRHYARNVQVKLSQVSVSSASVGFWNHEVSSSFPNVLSILQLPKLIIKVTLQLKMGQSLLVFKVIDRR